MPSRVLSRNLKFGGYRQNNVFTVGAYFFSIIVHCTYAKYLLPDLYNNFAVITIGTMLTLFKNLWCSILQFSYTVYTNRYYELCNFREMFK